MDGWIVLVFSHVAEAAQKSVGPHSIFAEVSGYCSVLVGLRWMVFYVFDLAVPVYPVVGLGSFPMSVFSVFLVVPLRLY